MLPTRMDWISSFRNLRRKPLYTITVAVALGIGVGAATTVFSWFEGLFLRPLPGVRDSRSLQVFELRRPDSTASAFSYPDYKDLQETLATSMDVAAYSMARVTLSGTGKPEAHWGLFVSGNFFPVLELKAGIGRLLQPSDNEADPVAVLSHEFWQARFRGDPSVIGTTIYLNRRPARIVGIAPPDFQGPYTGLSLGVYLPASIRDSIEPGAPRLESRQFRSFTVISRLKNGISQQQASERAQVAAGILDRAYPKGSFDQGTIVLTPFWQSPIGAQAIMGPVMIALGGIVLVVLLLACSNAASIMLIENSARRRELSIRMSLGSGSFGLIRYRLAEASLLSVLAACIGLFLASLAADHLQNLVPDLQFPVKVSFPIDGPVFAFAALAAAVAAGFCGLWSGLEARWQSTATTLRTEATTTSASRERSRVRGVFIGAQIALSFLLLSASALFYRSVETSRSAELGFDMRAVSLIRIDLNGSRYSGPDGVNVLRVALRRVLETGGVEAGSLATAVPLGLGNQERLAITTDEDPEPQSVWANRVSPGYFKTLSIPVLAGRDFSDSDVFGSEPIAIVNEAFAKKYWKTPLSVGRSFRIGDRRLRVAGIVRNTKIWSLTQEQQPYLYLPLLQSEIGYAVMHLKSTLPPRMIHRIVELEMERLDTALPVPAPQTMAQQVETAVFPQRIAFVMLSIFSLVGIYLTGIGLYGTIAHAVQSRAKEIAIRVALGATGASVCGLITRQAAVVVGSGLCAGALLTAALNQLFRKIVTGAEGVEPVSMIVTAVVICVVAMLATLLPILRSMKLQPATVLRLD